MKAWIYDPYYHWNVPSEYWQQDDTVFREPLGNLTCSNPGLTAKFVSVVTGPKFIRATLPVIGGFAQHSQLPDLNK